MAGWRHARMPTVPEVPYFELAPDWVCETISPSTAARDRVLKLEVYRRERVPYLWFLDPRPRTLEVLRLDGDGYRIASVHSGTTTVRAEPFDAIELDLGALWLARARRRLSSTPSNRRRRRFRTRCATQGRRDRRIRRFVAADSGHWRRGSNCFDVVASVYAAVRCCSARSTAACTACWTASLGVRAVRACSPRSWSRPWRASRQVACASLSSQAASGAIVGAREPVG